MESRIPQTAKCLACGYALRGLAEPTCPECGQSFDPEDTTTYDDGSINIRDMFALGLRVLGVWTTIYLIGSAFGLIHGIVGALSMPSPVTFPPGYFISQSVSFAVFGGLVWSLLFRADWIASRIYAAKLGFLPSLKSDSSLVFDLTVIGLRLMGVYAIILGLSPVTITVVSFVNSIPLSWDGWIPIVQFFVYFALAFALIFWAKPIAAWFDKSPDSAHPPSPNPPDSPDETEVSRIVSIWISCHFARTFDT